MFTPLFCINSVVFLCRHRSGGWYSETEIGKAANDALAIIEWLPSNLDIEDRKAYINFAEVLRPAAIPDDPLIRRFGTADGSTFGSMRRSSKFGA